MDHPISQHLPLLGYNLASENTCELGPAVPHSTYAARGVVDSLQRDGSFSHSHSTDLISTANDIRGAPPRPSAHDPIYPITTGLSDSSAGSISTSPSSSVSSLPYPTSLASAVYAPSNTTIGITTNPYPTADPVFPNHYSFPHAYASVSNARPRLNSLGDTTSRMLNTARSPGLGNPMSPTSTTTIRDQYATSTPGISRHLVSPRSTVDSFSRPCNGYAAETPRAMMSSPGMPMSPQDGSISYKRDVDRRASDSPPFLDQENYHDIVCNGQTIRSNIDAKVEKGFFMSLDNSWTCYRRNYFSVQCSYSLTPYPANAQLYLVESGQKNHQSIQALAICLSAAVDNGGGKSIELVQHTPKRDKGPQNPVQITKLAPTPPGRNHAVPHGFPMNTFDQSVNHQAQLPPYLPLQAVGSRNAPEDIGSQGGYSQHNPSPTAHQHTFERIQFKSATANNGKRRAQQQYYHLIVELWADVRNINDKEPKWKKVAQRVSHQVVVRGRSPSHYQNEGPHSTSTRGGSGGPSGTGSGNLSMPGGLGATNVGYTRAYGNAHYSPNYRTQTYRGNFYSLDPSPIGSTSMSSTSSNEGMPIEPYSDHSKSLGMHSNGDEDEPKGYDATDAYQYIPGPLYDNGPAQHAKAGLGESMRLKDEAYGAAFPPGGVAQAAWRLKGVDSSRGFYPTLATGY